MTFRSWSLLIGTAVVIAAGGCGRPVPPAPVVESDREAENPWAKAVITLRKDTDVGTCRRVLADLTTAASTPGGTGLPATPDEDLKVLIAALGLKDDEVREIAGAGFTGLDATYLADCFYLRDAAATLEATGLPPAVAAERALAWVCRQVRLVPMGSASPAPATLTLRRGTGSGLDRAATFAAVAQQLELDVVLVGTPAANAWPPDVQPGQSLAEPFWAVAVRDGSELLLFDPIRGLPFPGPTPGKPATFADLKANPDLLKPWAADGQGPLPSADDVKASRVFPTVPLSAVSARMAAFQLAGDELGVRAAVNWPAVAKALEGCGVTPTPWAPPRFTITPTLGQREYLPMTDGGTAVPDPKRSPWMSDYYPRLVPYFAPPAGSESGVAERLVDRFRNTYINAVLETAPREKLQRGQYLDAAQLLVKLRSEFRALSERATGDPARAAAVSDWLTKTNDLYNRFAIARLDVGTPAGEAAARQLAEEIEKKWKEQPVETMISRTLADPIFREATFLLALTKHEQAERAQATAGKNAAAAADAKKSWVEANGWWERYLPLAVEQEKRFPGRTAHAQSLAARAATFR